MEGSGYHWCQEAIDTEKTGRPWWMARGIVENGGVAILRDRQGASWDAIGFDEFKKTMKGGVIEKACKKFKEIVKKEGQYSIFRSREEFELYDDEHIRVIATPNASYGYLYIFAYEKEQPVAEEVE